MPSRALRTAALALLVSFGFVEAAAAYYSPRLGRFLNRDPIGEAGAVLLQRVAAKTAFVPRDPVGEEHQLYVYVKNAPTLYVDPFGLKKCSPATGSLRCFMEKHAADHSPFTGSGKPDPDNRITWKLLSCLACRESNYNPCAQNGQDTGLMQLRQTGAIAQCQKLGILKPFDASEFGEARKKKCCSFECQPRCGYVVITVWALTYISSYEQCRCCEGCEDSIWNIDNQIKCAAAYLQWLRDSTRQKITLPMLICRYNKGPGSPDCRTDESSRRVGYVKDVLECLGEFGKLKPGDPGVVTPPKELQ